MGGIRGIKVVKGIKMGRRMLLWDVILIIGIIIYLYVGYGDYQVQRDDPRSDLNSIGQCP